VEWLLSLLVSVSAGHFCYPPEDPDARVRNGSIAFSRWNNLDTIGADGSGFMRITDEEVGESSPSWSPDGSRLAFTCGESGYAGKPTQEICTSNPDGTDVKRLTFDHKADDEPSWSPDGRHIVFTRILGKRFHYGSSELFVMSSDGGDMRRLTHRPGSEDVPSFSPDGCRIMFGAGSKEGPYRYAPPDRGLYSVNLQGEDLRRELDVQGRYEGAGRWSPDGRSIVFEVGWWIYLHDVETGEELKLAHGIAPSWSPDGRWIVYQDFSNRNQTGTLRRVNPVTGKIVIFFRRNGFSAAWGPRT
jgi:Tol biopolymer transport system component